MSDEPPPQRLRAGPRALCYASSLPLLQRVAREHGYALAVHGSMQTDFDLLACPWTDEAADAETLVTALAESFGGIALPRIERNPVVKPHGRRAWAFHIPPDCQCYLDLSVVPREQDWEQRRMEQEWIAANQAELDARSDRISAEIRRQNGERG